MINKISQFINNINNPGIIIHLGINPEIHSYIEQYNLNSKFFFKFIKYYTSIDSIKCNYNINDIEFGNNMLNYKNDNYPNLDFYLFTNIQNINNICHGWITYKNSNNMLHYHINIENNTYNYKELKEILQLICLDILICKNDYTLLTNGYVDIIKDENNINILPLHNIINSQLSTLNYNDTYQVYTNDNQNITLIDFLLECKEELVIFKGSFNPIHIQHYNMYKSLLDSKRTVCLLISIDDKDNKSITSVDLMKKIKLLNKLNITIIVNKSNFFNDIAHKIQQHNYFKNKKLSFLVGDDVLYKFLKEEKDKSNYKLLNNIKFYVAQRTEKILKSNHYDIEYLNINSSMLSSTEVRITMQKDNFKNLKEIYDINNIENNNLYNLIIKNM